MSAPDQLKVLILSHISELLGGAERSMLELVGRWVNERNINPEFILRKPVGSLGHEISKRGWKFYELDYSFWSHTKPLETPEEILVHASQNSAAVIEIEKIIQTTKPDVVITNSVVSPWAALAAYYQKIPHVWFVREYGDLDHSRTYELGREKTLQDVGNLSDLVVANSKALQAHLKNYINPNKLTYIYPPLELIKQGRDKAENPYKFSSSLKLMMTGNIAISKGQLQAVKAVAELYKNGADIELAIIGDSGGKELMDEIRKIIKKAKLSRRVHLLGFQPNSHRFVKFADIGIMASTMEAFGRVTFEYLCAGKAVVGSDSGGTPEQIKNGHNGFLFKPGDVKSLISAITNYVENPKLAGEHGKHALEVAKEVVNSNKVDELFDRIEKIIMNPRKDNRTHINLEHRIIEYQSMANKNLLSLRPLLRLSAKRKAKKYYLKIRRATGRTMKG